MADLTKIFSGMESGPEAIQSNFEEMNQTVENMGGVVDQLQWTEPTDEGIVYQNGFQNIGGAGQANTNYRYIVIGNKKLVELQIGLHLMTDPGASVKALTALSVPDTITPDYVGTPHAQDDKYQSDFLDGRLEINKMKDSDSWWFGTGSFYVMHVMYISSK